MTLQEMSVEYRAQAQVLQGRIEATETDPGHPGPWGSPGPDGAAHPNPPNHLEGNPGPGGPSGTLL